MTFVIDDIVTSFSDRISSHRSAWPRMQKCMLEDGFDQKIDIAFGDSKMVNDATWLVSTPMEFKGEVFNLFGGYTEEVRDRISRLLDFTTNNVKAIDLPIPDIESILRPRAEKTNFNFSDAEWSKIKSFQNCFVINHEDLTYDVERTVIGDSHAIARYRNKTVIHRHDGLTLHRLLENTIESYLPQYKVKHLVIVAGNIDIRHHLLRRPDPNLAAISLATKLSEQLKMLVEKGLIESYEVTSPYPIEFEERRIPKTGYYKKTPFYGSRKDRNKIRATFQSALDFMFENVFYWPKQWYDMDPEEYAKIYMEKPGSVHLSPEFYEWDLLTNMPNSKLAVMNA